jgi:hypothetical protein
VTAVGATSHQITVNNMPPGRYEITINALFYAGAVGTGVDANFRLHDGTSALNGRTLTNDTRAFVDNFVTAVVTYTTAGTRTFKVQSSDSGTATPGIYNATTGRQIVWTVKRFPSSSEVAYRPDQVAWRVDANISGANPDLGSSDQTSYIGITNGSLTLTNNTGNNVLTAQIPCSTTNAPSGTTCSSGDESIGVSFNLPVAGDVLACVSFGHGLLVGASGIINTTFQLVETPTNAQTILQEGKSTLPSLANNDVGVNNPIRLCGNFTFASAGQKVIRLMYEQDITTPITTNILLADGNVNLGQRSIHWEVYPLNYSTPAPLLVNSVTSSNSGLTRVEHVRFGGASEPSACTSTPCTVYASSGSAITGVTRGSAGLYSVGFAAGAFTSGPTCTCSSFKVGSIAMACSVYTTSTAGISVQTYNSATAANEDSVVNVQCTGNR